MLNPIAYVREDCYVDGDMAWTVPQYTEFDIINAGKILIDEKPQPDEADKAFQIIDNFRSSHNFPLNTFQVGLRRKAKDTDAESLVAQRIKRLSSISNKLLRIPRLDLFHMQDIAGCRAVVKSNSHVHSLVELYKKSGIKHKLMREVDYITKPKGSGYRSFHLIYSYYSDKKDTYNGLQVEVQIRTLLQHAWATAVETVGTFTRQSLKSSQGEEDWLRFFALMGSAIAKREGTALIPDTPQNPDELKQEIIRYEKQLDVEYHLAAWGEALKTVGQPEVKDAHFYLLQLDADKKQLTVIAYKMGDLNQASEDYLKIEREIVGKNADAVLVSAESLGALRRAYPNYYLDTKTFMEIVKETIE